MKRGLLRIEFVITGGKLNYLPALLNARNICIYNHKPISENSSKLTIDFCDCNKFFAICKNMCYNKQIVKYKGILSPLFYLYKNVGIFIGVILFCLLCFLGNNYLLEIDVEGSGSCFSNQTKIVLESLGVKKYCKFSSLDFKNLENEILKTNAYLSFVSVKKSGNRLIVNSVLSDSQPSVLGEDSKNITSPYSGIIDSISVLRGTALVKVGDKVEKGTELVGAYLLGKEDKSYPTYILARITIISIIENFVKYDGEITEKVLRSAEKVAEFQSDGEVLMAKAVKSDGGIIITLTIKHTIDAGY